MEPKPVHLNTGLTPRHFIMDSRPVQPAVHVGCDSVMKEGKCCSLFLKMSCSHLYQTILHFCPLDTHHHPSSASTLLVYLIFLYLCTIFHQVPRSSFLESLHWTLIHAGDNWIIIMSSRKIHVENECFCCLCV